MLHVHNLDHVEIYGFLWHLDGFNSVDNNFSQRIRESRNDLGIQRSARNFDQEVSGHFLLDCESIQEAEGLHLGKLKAIYDVSWVHALPDDVLGLAHQFTNEEHIGGGSISDDIVLGSSGTPNHGCSGMLDLLKRVRVLERGMACLPSRRATLYHPWST